LCFSYVSRSLYKYFVAVKYGSTITSSWHHWPPVAKCCNSRNANSARSSSVYKKYSSHSSSNNICKNVLFNRIITYYTRCTGIRWTTRTHSGRSSVYNCPRVEDDFKKNIKTYQYTIIMYTLNFLLISRSTYKKQKKNSIFDMYLHNFLYICIYIYDNLEIFNVFFNILSLRQWCHLRREYLAQSPKSAVLKNINY